MSTTMSPVQICMPLVKAACEPKFRVCVIATTRGSAAARPASTVSESSGLPSFTKMSSRSTDSAASARVRRSYMCGIARPSL